MLQNYSSMQFSLQCWKAMRRSSSVGKSNVAWSLLTDNSLTVFGWVILFFRNLFPGLFFTNFLMHWDLLLPTWLELIFCEANWVTVLSWHFDRTLEYFSRSLSLSATLVEWLQNPSLLHFEQLLSQEAF